MKTIITAKMKAMGKRLAEYLDNKVKKFSVVQIRLLLFVFCLFTGTICISIIRKAFHSKIMHPGTIFLRPLAIPGHIGKPITLPPEDVRSSDEVSHILELKRLIDSVSQYDSPQFRELLRSGPGLMDSMKLLESIYLYDQKTRK
jgi:hypothetical protein